MPSSPAYFISWTLYSMLTRDMDTLLINSEEPLEQVFPRARRSRRHFPSRSRLLLGRAK